VAEDLYTILGVSKDASTQDIKKAFRQLALECHPDVAGDDPEKAERFKKIRSAYEVLSDPVQRARYDRRGEKRSGPFLGSMWGRTQEAESRKPQGAQDLDLEDLVSSFGQPDFGFGGGPRPGSGRSRVQSPPPRGVPGKTLYISVDVPEDIAKNGGSVTVSYRRMRRADTGNELFPYEEIHDLRIPPGMTGGSELRVSGMGDAGANGGPYGELVCELRVIPGVRHSGRMKMPRSEAAEEGREELEVLPIRVGVVEAVLGGRVAVVTPQGTVRLTLPPGTDSGTRLRLKGKGKSGGDLYVEVKIVVPKNLDEESRRLMERFGELNPEGE
jgi:curved DNA-binding protein